MSTEPRLKSRLVVQALIRQAESAGFIAAILHKGDDDAGGIMLVIGQMDIPDLDRFFKSFHIVLHQNRRFI